MAGAGVGARAGAGAEITDKGGAVCSAESRKNSNTVYWWFC